MTGWERVCRTGQRVQTKLCTAYAQPHAQVRHRTRCCARFACRRAHEQHVDRMRAPLGECVGAGHGVCACVSECQALHKRARMHTSLTCTGCRRVQRKSRSLQRGPQGSLMAAHCSTVQHIDCSAAALLLCSRSLCTAGQHAEGPAASSSEQAPAELQPW